MHVGVMITNGGPHPPEKWAELTAGEIISLIDIAPSPGMSLAVIEKKELEAKFLRLMFTLHGDVQAQERAKIASDEKHLLSRLDPMPYIERALAEIVKAAEGTMFADHYQKPEVHDWIKAALGQRIATEMHIERSWHSDKNPENELCKAYRKRRAVDAAA